MNIRQMKTPKLRELLNGVTAESPLHDEITVELRKRSVGTPRRLRDGTLYSKDLRRMHRQTRLEVPYKTWLRAQPKLDFMTDFVKKVQRGPYGR